MVLILKSGPINSWLEEIKQPINYSHALIGRALSRKPLWYWYSPLEICSNLWLLVWMCLLTDYFLLKSVTLTPTIQFWSIKCSLLNLKLYPKRVFSRLATAVSKKRNRTDPAKPTTIVKAGVDDSIVLPICMALNGDNGGYHERGALV